MKTYVDCVVPLLEMDESVVLDFLDSIYFAVRFKNFFQLLLGTVLGEVPDVQNLDLETIFRKDWSSTYQQYTFRVIRTHIHSLYWCTLDTIRGAKPGFGRGRQ